MTVEVYYAIDEVEKQTDYTTARICCFNNLLSTVENQNIYVSDLNTAICHISSKFKEHEKFFQIIQKLNKYFLKMFNELNSIEKEFNVDYKLSPKLKPFIDDLKSVITPYINSKEDLLKLCAKVRSNNGLYEASFKLLDDKYRFKGSEDLFLKLEQYTIHIEQRIKDLIKYTNPSTTDYKDLEKLLTQVIETNQLINNIQQNKLNMIRLIKLKSMVRDSYETGVGNCFLTIIDCVYCSPQNTKKPMSMLLFQKTIVFLDFINAKDTLSLFEQINAHYNTYIDVDFDRSQDSANNLDISNQCSNTENYLHMKFAKVFSGLSKLNFGNTVLYSNPVNVKISEISKLYLLYKPDYLDGLYFNMSFFDDTNYNGSFTFMLIPHKCNSPKDFLNLKWPFYVDYKEMWNKDDGADWCFNKYFHNVGREFLNWFNKSYNIRTEIVGYTSNSLCEGVNSRQQLDNSMDNISLISRASRSSIKSIKSNLSVFVKQNVKDTISKLRKSFTGGKNSKSNNQPKSTTQDHEFCHPNIVPKTSLRGKTCRSKKRKSTHTRDKNICKFNKSENIMNDSISSINTTNSIFEDPDQNDSSKRDISSTNLENSEENKENK